MTGVTVVVCLLAFLIFYYLRWSLVIHPSGVTSPIGGFEKVRQWQVKV
jgi:hypothetical protein